MGLSVGLVAGSTGIVLAQAASNLAPSTFQPDNRSSTSRVTVARDPGAETPPGSENLFVTIGKVTLQDGLPQMAEANARFIASLQGKRVPASEIFRATRTLEQDYADAGFVLARVVLPQQTVVDNGPLRIVVIDGFIENVNTSAVPGPVRRRVEQLTDPLIGRRPLRLQEIERRLLLAGDTYGTRLSSTLSPGTATGATQLTLEGQYKRWTGSYGIDNVLSDQLGPGNLSAGLELNGALEMGETFYGRIGGSPTRFFGSDPQYRILAAGTVFPIGLDGLTFNLEATSSQSNPDDALVPTNSSFDRFSVRFYYPWIRSRAFNLTSQLMFDRVSDEQNVVAPTGDIPLYKDELSVLRASVDGNWAFDRGSFLQSSLILSKGLDAFGASSTSAGSSIPLSRQGADPQFTKLVLGFRYDHPLNNEFSMTVRGRLQENFGDVMPTSEQFNVAGVSELSTFDAGSVKGDDGWVLRAEVAYRSQTNFGQLPVVIKPYLFGAYARLGFEQPTIFE
ncbi:MAG: ShlB/FhaC/HecB family hemolysin secretion/activation protein, partial [Pseudomonadota bacterium]